MPEAELQIVPTASAADVAYVGKHPHGVVKAQKPRLKVLKQNTVKGAPVNTVAPAITGTPTVPNVQTCSSGTWQNSPTFAYQWMRKGGAIPGATTSTYTLAAVDHGTQVFCHVTATNSKGSVVARSNSVTVP
jgi:hypothetical protein